MNDNDDTLLHNKMERYVLGQLPPEEAAALDRDIAADPALQEMLLLHRMEQAAAEHLLRQRLRSDVRRWIAEMPPEPLPARWRFFAKKWGWLLLVLMVVVAVGIWFFYFKPRNGQRPAQQQIAQDTTLYAPPTEQPAPPAVQEKTPPATLPHGRTQDTKPAPQPSQKATSPPPKTDKPSAAVEAPKNPAAPPGTDTRLAQIAARSGDEFSKTEKTDGARGKSGMPSTDNSPLAQARRALAGTPPDTAAAISFLKKIQPAEGQYEIVQELLGQIFFHQKNYSEAARAFETLREPRYRAKTRKLAEWRLLLCWLQDYAANKARADELLNRIADPANGSDFQPDAQQLKRDLRL